MNRSAAVIFIGLGFALALAILGTVRWTRSSQRRKGGRSVTRDLEAQRLGFDYRGAGDKAYRARFADLGEVPRGAKIKHVHEGSIHGRAATVFEASYMVSTGASVVQVAHSIYAVEAPAWPETHITPRHWFARLVRKLGRPTGLELDDPEFNRRFKVKSHDEDFAIALLSPEMQAFMLTKLTTKWHITPGRLCLVYSGTLKRDRMEASLQRLRQFWELVPAELEAW